MFFLWCSIFSSLNISLSIAAIMYSGFIQIWDNFYSLMMLIQSPKLALILALSFLKLLGAA